MPIGLGYARNNAGDSILNCGGLHSHDPLRIASTPSLFHVILKGNVAVCKDLNIEFVTKKVFVTRTQCNKTYSSRAYCLFYACVGYDFVCDGDRACRATVEFQDRLQTLIMGILNNNV